MNGGGLCPMCRAPFRRTDVVPDSDVEMLINSSSGVCETCGVEVSSHSGALLMVCCGFAKSEVFLLSMFFV